MTTLFSIRLLALGVGGFFGPVSICIGATAWSEGHSFGRWLVLSGFSLLVGSGYLALAGHTALGWLT